MTTTQRLPREGTFPSVQRQGTFQKDSENVGHNLEVPVIDEANTNDAKSRTVVFGAKSDQSVGEERRNHAEEQKDIVSALQDTHNSKDENDQQNDLSLSISANKGSESELGKSENETPIHKTSPSSPSAGNDVLVKEEEVLTSKASLRTLTTCLQDSMAENDRLKTKTNQLEQEIQMLKEKLSSMQTEMEANVKRVQDYTYESEELKLKMSQKESETKKALEELGGTREEYHNYKKTMIESEKRHREDMKSLKDEKENLSCQVVCLEQQSSELQRQYDKSVAEVSELRAVLDNKTKQEDKLLKMQRQNKDLLSQVKCLEERLDKEKLSSADSASQINRERDKSNAEKAVLDHEVKQLRAELRNQQEFSEILLQRISKYNEQIDKLLQHNTSLLTVVDKEKTTQSELHERLKECQVANTSLEKELEAQREIIRSKGNDKTINKLEDENKKLRLLLMEKDFENTHILAEKNELREQLAQLQREQISVRDQDRDLNTHVTAPSVWHSMEQTSSRLPNNKSSNSTPDELPQIKTKTKDEVHFSWTMNYSSRWKYLQKLQRERKF